MLRDISKDVVSSPMDLKKELYRQLNSELVSSDLQFAVGYVKGNSNDVWKMPTTLKGETILWCDKVDKKKDSVISDN